MNPQMHRLRTWFFKGVALAAPLLLTLAITLWIAGMIESFLGELLKDVIPDETYVPGMGLVLGLALILALGAYADHYLLRRMVRWGERQMDRIPVVKTVFNGIKDISSMVASKKHGERGRVVSVDLGGFRLVGFVTQDVAFLGEDTEETEAMVAVYLPMSYQIGGYTLYLPKRCVTPLDVSAEEAMRAVLTGGRLTRA